MRFKNLVFLVSICCCLFWVTAQFVDVYAVKAIGIMFEILAIPLLLAGIVCFIISVVHWVRDKYSLRSPGFRTVVLFLLSVLIIVIRNSV